MGVHTYFSDNKNYGSSMFRITSAYVFLRSLFHILYYTKKTGSFSKVNLHNSLIYKILHQEKAKNSIFFSKTVNHLYPLSNINVTYNPIILFFNANSKFRTHLPI